VSHRLICFSGLKQNHINASLQRQCRVANYNQAKYHTQEFHIIRIAELGFSKHASIGSFFFHFFFHVSGLALAFCRGLCHFGRGKRAPSVRSGRKPHMPTYKRLTHQSITRKTIIFKTLNLILFLTFFFSLIKKKNPNHRLFQTPPPPPLFHDIRRRQPPEKF
jgi:hypothetical protein